MLERFFLKPQTVDRILRCWLGSRIEAYVTILCDQGYSTRTILRRVPILVEFASFTEARSVSQIEKAETVVDEFVADWVSARRADPLANACRRDRNLASATVRLVLQPRRVAVGVSPREEAVGRSIRCPSARILRVSPGGTRSTSRFHSRLPALSAAI